MPEIKLPKQSIIAQAAAEAAKSPIAVLLTVNTQTMHWETRIFGATDGYALWASHLADMILAALDVEPPPELLQQKVLLQSKPGTSS